MGSVVFFFSGRCEYTIRIKLTGRHTWSQVFSVSDQVLHGFNNLCDCQVLQDTFTYTDNFTHLKMTRKSSNFIRIIGLIPQVSALNRQTHNSAITSRPVNITDPRER